MIDVLRQLPAVHQLQKHERFLKLLASTQFSKELLTEWLQEHLNDIRKAILEDGWEGGMRLKRDEWNDMIFATLERRIEQFNRSQLQRVLNATGVVLHTNLGRARLSDGAIEQMTNIAKSYSTLEFNLLTGERGSRHDIVEDYLRQLTNAEAGIVVNNNAAAVFLVLKAIAAEKEVVVSRGELVEIGGSFRISEIMEESGAKLVAVGTTNKTHLRDYERAIHEDTALLMKVHKSNFNMTGFTKEVEANALVELAAGYDVPVYEDLGSGALFDFHKNDIGSEAIIQDKVKAGVDLISFSGDKLLGGPQAGLIVGKKALIEKLKNHQLARVLRVDKFTLAGLEATLKTYITGQAEQEIPTVRDILKKSDKVKEKAQTFVEALTASETPVSCQIERDHSKVGGGTMPEVQLETYVVKVRHPNYDCHQLAQKLRENEPPIIVRIKDEAIVLDFRTVTVNELKEMIEAFTTLT